MFQLTSVPVSLIGSCGHPSLLCSLCPLRPDHLIGDPNKEQWEREKNPDELMVDLEHRTK